MLAHLLLLALAGLALGLVLSVLAGIGRRQRLERELAAAQADLTLLGYIEAALATHPMRDAAPQVDAALRTCQGMRERARERLLVCRAALGHNKADGQVDA